MSSKQEIYLYDASIVDYRKIKIDNKLYVEYCVKIITLNNNILYFWRTYDDFVSLYFKLTNIKKYNSSNIIRKLNYSFINNLLEKYSNKFIKKRFKILDTFIKNAARDPHLQWGIKLANNIYIIKRRVK